MVLDYPLEFTQTEVSGALIPRLWAYQKVQALEAQIARFGAQRELLDDILALGLDYRLVTRRTSLFAPDEGVEINPEPREGSVTVVNDEHQTARWLGRDFILQDDVWIDLAYQPGMPKESYAGAPGQPAGAAAERAQPVQPVHRDFLQSAGRPGGRGGPPDHLQPGRPAGAPTGRRHAPGRRTSSDLGRPRPAGPGGGQRGVHIPLGDG